MPKKRGRPKGSKNSSSFGIKDACFVRVSKDCRDALKQLAAKERRSMGRQVEILVRDLVKPDA